jgi:hypothetical protein
MKDVENGIGILTSIRKTSFLPLRDAVLCNDCNFVSSDEQGVCPVCCGRSLDRLADRLRATQFAGTRHGLTLRGILQLMGLRRRARHADFAYFER